MPSTYVVDAAEQPRRGTRCSKAKNSTAAEDFASLFRSGWKLSKMPPPPGRRLAAPEIRYGGGSRYATKWKLMTKMPPPPGMSGTRCSSRAAWKEENKRYQSDQIHCAAAEELAPVLGKVAEKS